MSNPAFLSSGETCATLNLSGTVEDSNDNVTIRDTTGSSGLMESFRSHDGAGSKSQCFDAAFTMTLGSFITRRDGDTMYATDVT